MADPTASAIHWPGTGVQLRPWNCRSAAALAVAYENPKHRALFQRYEISEIMKGYEMAHDKDIFRVARALGARNMQLLLRFVDDDALDFFETLKAFRGSDIAECREAIVEKSDHGAEHHAVPGCSKASQMRQPTDTLRDSGYESRPSSEVRSSVTSSILSHATAASGYSCSSFPSSPRTHFEQPSWTDTPLTLEITSQNLYEPHLGHRANSPFIPQTPYEFAADASIASPYDAAKAGNSRPFECMYCAKAFVRHGDCLNHEKNYHSEKKEWTCPHCPLAFKTEGGHDRHHKAAHCCRSCTEPPRVRALSGPKTACACPFCGILFQGNSSFSLRSTHMETVHYKGEQRETRTGINHSRMIRSLLSRREFAGPWKLFLEGRADNRLTWSSENTRLLLDDLEFGHCPRGIQDQLQRVYELADKLPSLPGHPSEKQSVIELHHAQAAEPSTETFGTFTQSEPNRDHLVRDVNLARRGGEPMDFNHQTGCTKSPPIRLTSVELRTRQLLKASPTTTELGIPDLKGPSDSSQDMSSILDSAMRCPHPPRVLDDVFMGSRRSTPDSHTMDITGDRGNGVTSIMREPTPPSQTWNFRWMDDSVDQMEDILLESMLLSSQSFHHPDAQKPQSRIDSLPPSIREAASNAAQSPLGRLPWSDRQIQRKHLTRD